ncbi:hypothetical protein ACH5RR_015478 [Cinchona calisaya]|uniref:Uncharacterized protein n=1 Tax=Cinchona calisaya TaxID=153742 RepID=A0ABD2ZTB8_9GENT
MDNARRALFHLFREMQLFSIRRLVSYLLKIDTSMVAGTQPGKARICIELDLTKARLQVYAGHFDATFFIKNPQLKNSVSASDNPSLNKDNSHGDEKPNAKIANDQSLSIENPTLNKPFVVINLLKVLNPNSIAETELPLLEVAMVMEQPVTTVNPPPIKTCTTVDSLDHGFLSCPLAIRLWAILEVDFGVMNLYASSVQHKIQLWWMSSPRIGQLYCVIPILARWHL